MELPRLKSLYEKLSNRGLEIIVIDKARDTEGAKKFIEEKGLSYRFLENGEEDEEVVWSVFGVNGFPTSYLIDGEGKIQRAYLGFEEGDEEKYEKQILQLLEN